MSRPPPGRIPLEKNHHLPEESERGGGGEGGGEGEGEMVLVARARDAEAELNLLPGFRFHPTDEELVLHYLSPKAANRDIPAPIIAELDLYKYDPWLLPEKALFGQKEWYFFTPRDRKYLNGTRPNRAAGGGYWKATGADKPITPEGSGRPLGIKKALVFYAGKPPRGVKTNWIMHEYRLADADRSAHGSLRLDNWVLCRLYNKKSNWHQDVHKYGSANQQQGSPEVEPVDSFEEASPESYVDNGTCSSDVQGQLPQGSQTVPAAVAGGAFEDSDWFAGFNLDDFCAETFAAGLDFNFPPTPPAPARPPSHYPPF